MKKLIGIIAVAAGVVLASGGAFDAKAHVQMPPSDVIKASQADAESIVAAYGKIEEALAKEDIDTIMTFYADDYFHQGITKGMIRNLWSNIFKTFDNLNTAHVFSAVEVKDNEAIITCTGTLLGIPSDSKDKKYVAVDKWADTDHYLSKKGGSWKIVGGASHWLVEPFVKYGKDVKYQLEFHPLF